MNEQNGEQPRSRRRQGAFLAVAALVALIGAVVLFAAPRDGRDGSLATACSDASNGAPGGAPCFTPTATMTVVRTQQPAAASTSTPTPTYSLTPTPSVTATKSPTRVATLTATAFPSPTARPRPAAVTTVPPKTASVYRILNQYATPLYVEQVYTSTTGRTYVSWTTVPPHGTAIVRLHDVKSVPSGFQGKVTLYANRPFTATLMTDPPK